MIKQYESHAKKLYQNKNYKECLKNCFIALSIDPSNQWIYDLCGYSYLQLNMFSQSKGCFNTALELEKCEQKKENYKRLINLCNEKEYSCS